MTSPFAGIGIPVLVATAYRAPMRAPSWTSVRDIPDTVAGLFDELLAEPRRPRSWQPVSVLDIAELMPEPDVDTSNIVSPWPTPPDWHADAVCASADPKTLTDPIFFGSDNVERPALPPQAVALAREMCYVCPASAQCLLWALENDERFGIWGGTTGRQRTAMRKALREERVTVSGLLAVYA